MTSLLYIIDGHNLIPNIRGMNLADLDDELELIGKLQDFANQKRASIEVFFDKATPGHGGSRNYGKVRAHFIPSSTIADIAIIKKVRSLGGAARNCTVVSSDNRIIAECKSVNARMMAAVEFAQLLENYTRMGDQPKKGDRTLSEEEVDKWLRLFHSKPGNSK